MVIAIMAACVTSCGEADVIKPYGSTEMPGKVSVTQVVNGLGRSVVYYKLPDDTNLHYVKAVYQPRPGVESEVNASFLTDSLVLTGFQSSGNYDVKLYSISYGDVWSEPATVTVTPDTPPYQYALQTLEVAEGFGGLTVRAENPTESNLVVTVFKQNEAGQWDELVTRYTQAENIAFAVRGQEPTPSMFKVNIKDRWGSEATSEEYGLTPILEIECDKTKMVGVTHLKGDQTVQHATAGVGGLYAAFDGVVPTTFDQDFRPSWHTAPNTGIPQHFTIDLGATYIFSRLVWWPRHVFYNGHPRRFEVYGALELNPDPDRELYDADGVLDPYWTLLGSFESFRPTGEIVPTTIVPLTEDEKNLNLYGEEFEFSLDVVPARYVRYRTLETWGSVTYVECDEISFFGVEVSAEK